MQVRRQTGLNVPRPRAKRKKAKPVLWSQDRRDMLSDAMLDIWDEYRRELKR